MIGVKRAALSIYGLEKSDQEWILGSLPADDRDKVIDAIKYIETLRIDTHEGGLAELVADEIEIIESSELENARVMQVDLTPMSIIRGVLSAEPSEIKDVIINHRQWSWKNEYIEIEGYKAGKLIEGVVSDVVVNCIIDTFLHRVLNHNSDTSHD